MERKSNETEIPSNQFEKRIDDLESENILLKRVLFMMKEDLNVKNEQFEFLYSSLRASEYQFKQEKLQKETDLRERVKTLENAIREKEGIQRSLESQLIIAHERLNEMSQSRLENFPTDVLLIIFGYLNHKDLCRSSCVNKSWNSFSSSALFWKSLFRHKYPNLPQSSSDNNNIKSQYRHEHVLNDHWRTGRVASYDEIYGHHGTITGLICHESNRLMSSSDDGSLCLWDMTSSNRPTTIPPSLGLMTLLDPSILTHKPHTVHCADRIMSFHGHGGPVWCLSCDWSAGLVASGSYDQTIKVWELSSGKCIRTLRGHAGWVSAISLITHTNMLLSTSWDSSLRVWDRDSGVCRFQIHTGVGNALYCLDLIDSTAAVGCRNNSIQLHDIHQNNILQTLLGHTRDVYAIKMDNNVIVSGSGDSLLKMWDRRMDMPCIATLRGHTGAVMCLDMDLSRYRIVSGSYDKSVRVWDSRMIEGTVAAPLHPAAVFAVQATPSRLITGCADNAIRFHDYCEGK